MTPNSNGEFASNKHATNGSGDGGDEKMPPTDDVLLNNFQIKKKSYRVLLNGRHFVWERMQQQQQQKRNKEKEQQPQVHSKDPEVDQLAIGSSYGCKSHVLHLDDIVSVRKGDTKQATLTPLIADNANNGSHNNSSSKPTAQYLTVNYAERRLKSATDCNRWHVRHLCLYNADPYIVHQWHQELNARLYSGSESGRMRVRRLLVFINPYGGRKNGLQTYERDCKPLFQLAGIDATCITTQRANQIRDILLSHDLSVYDAVCCVGGDGTVAEVINGLLFRAMRELGLDERRPTFIPKPMLPVGVIPAGSTDTIAYSMHGTADVRTAAIHILLGQRRGLDVSSVSNSRTLLRFCASVMSYGYLGDVAAKSEQYRWMGTKRYEYTGVKAFIGNRGYEAELRFLVADEDATSAQSPQTPGPSVLQRALSESSVGDGTSVCYANCQRCSFAASLQDQTSALFDPSQMMVEQQQQEHQLELPQSEGQQSVIEMNSEVVATLVQPRPPRPTNISLQASASLASSLNFGSPTTDETQWKCLRGKFFMICGANITCACSRSPNGISRYSHLGDGYVDLILVRKTSLLNNVRFLLNTAGRNGDIRNLPFVEVYRTRKFNFRTLSSPSHDESYNVTDSCQPIAELDGGGGGDGNGVATLSNEFSSWNCDGEVVTDLDITMRSHCQLIDVFMRGPHSYSKPQKAGGDGNNKVTQTPTSSTDNVYCCCKD